MPTVRYRTTDVDGVEVFHRDIPGADVRFLDTGHFALETHARPIAAAIREFLDV